MQKLYFEKLSQFDRQREPVTVGIPFAQGRLLDASHFTIRDHGRSLPVQRRVLAAWEDGSVKWLLVHFQPNLPGNDEKTFEFAIEDNSSDVQPQVSVAVHETEAGIEVGTGPIQFRVPREGFVPVDQVRIQGEPSLFASAFRGFEMLCDGQPLSSLGGTVELEVEESGPLRAVILVSGTHRRADGSPFIAFRGRITAYAGKCFIEVEHQFLHTEEPKEISLEQLTLRFCPEVDGEPQLALGQGYYRTGIQQGTKPLEMLLDAETLLYQANEHFIDSFYGDFWADWRDERVGVTLSIQQAHQNFPKKLRVTAEGIDCGLYPSEAPPTSVLQGMAKTHRLQLQFHGPDTSLEECSVRSLQFQLPDQPSLPRSWYRENNPWGESFFPEQLPKRLISHLNRQHDGRPKALGMFHFGDAPNAGYTNQGRGKGQTVWVNNEYDRPHCCALYYGLTGQRRVLDSSLVAARHWLDVDLCHYSPDPMQQGGLKIHTRYHVTSGVTPSHEWTEGFLDYYFLTGRREGLEAARSVAENIMRHMAQPRMRQPGQTAVREGGWALRAMVGMWLGTGEDKWKAEAKRLVDMFLEWQETQGALLAPYTSHSMPRVPFMISLTVNSFARYLLIEDDERIKKLIVETVDDLLEHCLGPDGIFYYKELPSLRRTAPTPHALESLTYAYRITGDVKYLQIAARQFHALAQSSGGGGGGRKFVDASGAVIAEEGGGRNFASGYTSILIFAGEAAKRGLLDWYEYPF